MTTVNSTEFYFEKNNKEHRTDEISIKRLILRRGQEFHITVNFSQNGFRDKADKIVLIAETGLKASVTSGTKIFMPLSDSLGKGTWNTRVLSQSGDVLSLAIISSPNARIGRYTLNLQDTTEEQVSELGEFVLLFNPWCTEDEVFLDNAEQREEYVMNETGIIFQNKSNFICSKPWIFGQFHEKVVDICLKLLDKNPKCLRNPTKDYIRRNDPVYISRVVTAMVNSDDDSGILEGRWCPPYDSGKPPSRWMGSFSILYSWNRNSCLPVRYGQCWVFAAVACTVLRCLGIPTRVVTNFESAHDTNGNLTVDNEVDEYGGMIGRSKDSIWNFHVWIEAWMARNDLKPGFDGWQVLDPTPQEKSEGVYCCGPAPVKAIKEGQLDVKFDVPFVYAEVNADKVDWLCYRNGRKEKTFINSTYVGQKISTKAVGSKEREDITANYKYPEGNAKERMVFSIAELKNKHEFLKEKQFNLSVQTEESISVGKDINAFVNITNKSDKRTEYKLNFCAQVIRYTGKPIKESITKNINKIVVEPHAEKPVPIELTYNDYGKLLIEHNLIKLTAVGSDTESNETLFATKIISLENPSVDIKFLDEPVQNQEVKVEIYIANPLPVPLNQCVLTIEGPGLIDWFETRIDEISVNHATTVQITIVPTKSGMRDLLVDFDCDKIKDVKGFKTITVKSA
ncbi:protein-glutamine gamma-glutamyltransferase 2 [Callorhinchus milii]|uniref:protein-glutamine gamma-glutamyltransferase 2 n=1 Tax=Callorhinchus milii TaxID=7868 RepID=UPI001C3F7AD6|nr:protein-glutamine gamma-glutamyltransferase 2 [Callorhinchus milii]